MKNKMLKWGLLVLLVCAMLGGSAIAINAGSSTPSLQVTSNSGASPGMITVSGKNWTPADEVRIYLDKTAPTAPGAIGLPIPIHVAVVTPAANGSFVKSFPISTTWVGTHMVSAIQNLNQATAYFKITASDMNWYLFYTMQQTLNTVKDEVESTVKAESDHELFTEPGEYHDVIEGDYDTVRHVSLTLKVHGLGPQDYVKIKVKFFGGYGVDAIGDPEALGEMDNDDLALITEDGTYVYQFDAQKWDVKVDVNNIEAGGEGQLLTGDGSPRVWMGWNLTTYEPNYVEDY